MIITDWFYILPHNLCTTVQIGSTLIRIKAHLPESAEYDRLWAMVCGQNRQYQKYREGLVRQIPIVILMPQPSS